jgi:hypothetical protein
MKFTKLGIVILLVSPLATAAWPQQGSSSGQMDTAYQPESLGDAARHAREQKKQEPKPAKVWTNDDIPKTGEDISIIGTSNESAPSESFEKGKSETKPAGLTPADKADLQSRLDDAKAQLASLKNDLDIAQRKYALDEQTYLSNPNHRQDTAGAAALDDEKQQIANKQEQIADMQERVNDLQAQLAAATTAPAENTPNNSGGTIPNR